MTGLSIIVQTEFNISIEPNEWYKSARVCHVSIHPPTIISSRYCECYNHQMTSLKRNKTLNIRTIANYLKRVGEGEGGVKSFDFFSQPLHPKIVSATLVLRRNIEGISIQSLVSWEGMVRSESENTNCMVISCYLKL